MYILPINSITNTTYSAKQNKPTFKAVSLPKQITTKSALETYLAECRQKIAALSSIDKIKQIAAEMKYAETLFYQYEINKRLNVINPREDMWAKHLSNKGFDRIVGYSEEKNILHKYFISEIQKEKNEEKANIPNSVIFFGLSGMGKSLFTRACAEESGCRIIPIQIGIPNKDKINECLYQKFIEQAALAQENFNKSGLRTVLLWEELRCLYDKDFNIESKLKDFLNTCSEKYHCSVLMTTNYPQILTSLNNNESSNSIIIPLDPINTENKNAILNYFLDTHLPKGYKIEDLTCIIEVKEKASNSFFNISRLEHLCHEYITGEHSIGAFTNIINNSQPNIKQEKLQEYYGIKSKILDNNPFGKILKYNDSYIDNFLASNNDINSQDKDGNTILHNYAILGNTNAFYKIINNSTIDTTIVNNDDMTAFDILLKNYNDKTAQIAQIGFNKVIGMDSLKQTLKKSFIIPLINKTLFDKYKLSISNGLLLYGLPGCGKTFIAEALAEETGRKLYKISPSDIASKYYDYATQKIKEIFENARKNSPAMILIDEMESIAPKRSDFTGSTNGAINQDVKQRVGELLQQMNNLSNDGLFVVGATNHPNMVDEAIKRPGRLDRRIFVPPPDFNARIGLFLKELALRPVDLNLDFFKLAKLTENYTAKEISLVVDEAAYRALNNIRNINMDDLLYGIKQISPSITPQMISLYENL